MKRKHGIHDLNLDKVIFSLFHEYEALLLSLLLLFSVLSILGAVWFRVVCLVCVACVMWSVPLWKVEANDWRNRERVVLDLFSNLKMGKIQGFLWWTSEARGQILVSRTGDDSPCLPCVRSKRPRVYRCAWCQYTRGRFERTHGDVLDGHTVFSACTQQNNNTTTTQQGDRDIERQQRQTETEKEKTREDGRGEDKTREERRAKMKEKMKDKTREEKMK